jgi:hypothetical protein
METKPISRLNITQLKALIASTDSASEKEKAKERLTKLQTKPKPVLGWSKEEAAIDIPSRVDPINAMRMLRDYYSRTYKQPSPVNDTTKTVVIDTPPKGILSDIEKDYEMVEINIKLVRKI